MCVYIYAYILRARGEYDPIARSIIILITMILMTMMIGAGMHSDHNNAGDKCDKS